MVTARDVKQGTGCLLLGVAYPIIMLLGLIIHIWTVVIAYFSGGIVAVLISLMLPVLAELYWGYTIWSTTGTFFNLYCLALLAYVVAFMIASVGISMADDT